jgi:hypothetical protein
MEKTIFDTSYEEFKELISSAKVDNEVGLKIKEINEEIAAEFDNNRDEERIRNARTLELSRRYFLG